MLTRKTQICLPAAAAVAVLAEAAPALACSVCQGDPASDMTKGAQAGIIFMAAITYGLLIGVAGLVVTWVVRARRMGSPL